MRVRQVERLDAAAIRDVRALAAAVRDADGAEPLNDQTLLALDSDTAVHLLAGTDSDLVGYAQVADGVAEIAVGPHGDRAALAATLLDAVAQHGADLVWAHGERSPIGAVLRERGAVTGSLRKRRSVTGSLRKRRSVADRTLLQLRRPDAPVADAAVPAGVTLRAFVVGQDEDAWLAVNARAFAHHREQGRWTRADLEAREREDWFDPAGFLLAVDASSGDLLGFHWTKIHAGPPPIGEVYVIAVDPSAQGRGLSKVLLAAGLRHLHERGTAEVLLYTDDDNSTARTLYEKAGFVLTRTDVQYRLTG